MADTAKAQLTTGKKIGKAVVSIFSTVLLVCALLLLIVVLSFRLSGDTPKLLGISFHLVVTDSMTPEIAVNDLVFAKETPIEDIVIGDDVVFVSKNPKLDGILIVHRVIKLIDGENGRELVTQGIKDGAPPDAPTNEIVGRVVGKSTVLGNIIYVLINNFYIMFIILFVLVGAIVVSQLITVYKAGLDLKRAKAEEEAKNLKEKYKAEILTELKGEQPEPTDETEPEVTVDDSGKDSADTDS